MKKNNADRCPAEGRIGKTGEMETGSKKVQI